MIMEIKLTDGGKMKRMWWGYPYKSREKADKKLAQDLRFFGGNGDGN